MSLRGIRYTRRRTVVTRHPNGFADNPESRGQKAAIGLGLMVGTLALDFANGAAYAFQPRVSVTLTPAAAPR